MSGERPLLWVLAGGNGAGKSTYYRLFIEPRGLPFVNADTLAARIDPENAEQASYEAAQLTAQLRDALLQQGVSFCFETVFSHPSKIDFIAQAKGLGYEITMVYIHLESAELNVARVAQRVSEGGHSVPVEKIRSRLPRTMDHVRAALPLVDRARIYDNSFSTAPFRAVADLRQGTLRLLDADPPAWARAILADYR